MSAPLGNRFWEMRSSHGRNPIFATPGDLWSACCEYFDWVDTNPLIETKAMGSKEGPQTIELPKMRAMTIASLCIFLDISTETWSNYRAREDFLGVTSRVGDIIRTQKFQGAAAELLNPNIIARDLGLADRSEQSGPDGGAIKTENLTRIERVIVHRRPQPAANDGESHDGAED